MRMGLEGPPLAHAQPLKLRHLSFLPIVREETPDIHTAHSERVRGQHAIPIAINRYKCSTLVTIAIYHACTYALLVSQYYQLILRREFLSFQYSTSHPLVSTCKSTNTLVSIQCKTNAQKCKRAPHSTCEEDKSVVEGP
jgi:hypothetical protein